MSQILCLGGVGEEAELVVVYDSSYFEEVSHFLLVFDRDVLETLLDDLLVRLLVLQILAVVVVFDFLQNILGNFVVLEDSDAQTQHLCLSLFPLQNTHNILHRVVGQLLLDRKLL